MVAVLLCFKLWRCTDFHHTPVHRAADATLNTSRRRRSDKTKDKDGYAVRAILPRPKRRGLLRTGSVANFEIHVVHCLPETRAATILGRVWRTATPA